MTSIRKLSAIFRTGSGGLLAFPNGEQWLLLALIAEIFLFSLVAPRFLVWTNLIEVLRFSVELGLLTIALTPVLITGGIDLSVGSTRSGLTTVAVGVAVDPVSSFDLPASSWWGCLSDASVER